jgi:hypothetical protein
VRSLTGGSPGGPRSSAFATGPDGLAAYAALLARAGHRIERLRATPADAKLDPGSTVVLLDPGVVSHRDADALRRFVEAGGRLVAGGRPTGWLGRIVPKPPAWSTGRIAEPHVLAPAPETRHVSRVVTKAGSWEGGGALPLLGRRKTSLVDAASVGKGRVLLLADAAPLHNRSLGSVDDAALGLGLAGAAGRPVAFLETYHGYGASSGLDAIPSNWVNALVLAVAASLLYMASRARRLGPPQDEERPLPPPRREFVESLGGVLARTHGRDEALEPLRARARTLLVESGRLPYEAGPEELRAAAVGAGVPEEEANALVAERPTDAAVVAAGRALARLQEESLR